MCQKPNQCEVKAESVGRKRESSERCAMEAAREFRDNADDCNDAYPSS